MIALPTKGELITIASELCHRKFTPGIDNVSAQSNLNHLLLHGDEVTASLHEGTYRPQPALRFISVQKSGKERELCRFSAIDVVVLRAIARKLSEGLNDSFSPYSFAYIPGRGVSAAVMQFSQHAEERPFVAVIDPADCFHSIDCELLYPAIEKATQNTALTNLIRSFLEMPTADEFGIHERPTGILQGSPLSPVLCNLYFDELDHMLTERGISFCRYGDDIVVFGRSKEEVTEYASTVMGYLTDRLHLLINPDKFRITSAEETDYLGYTFLREGGRLIAVEGKPRSTAFSEDWIENRLFTSPKKINLISDGILSRKDFSLLFEQEDGKTVLPAGSMEQLNVYSSVTFAPYVMKEAFRHGLKIQIFDLYGQLLGSFTPASKLKNIAVPLNQLEIYRRKKGLRADYARDFLLAQVHHLLLNLRYQVNEYGNSKCSAAIQAIREVEKRIRKCKEPENLLLFEAQIRELYYGCFPEMLRNPGFTFTKRSRRPPKDEVNAMISFGNTFLYNYIAVEINRTALDIRIAFLHSATSRAESLNLDLADILKPLIVDRVILALINKRRISPKQFVRQENGGVLLNNEGKKLFLNALSEKLAATVPVGESRKSYAEIIRDEVRALSADIKALKKHRCFRQTR